MLEVKSYAVLSAMNMNDLRGAKTTLAFAEFTLPEFAVALVAKIPKVVVVPPLVEIIVAGIPE